MSKPSRPVHTVVWTILCLAVLAFPFRSFALTYLIDGVEDDREEWNGPGDPEGGDRMHGDLIIINPAGSTLYRTDDPDRSGAHGTPTRIELIPYGDGYLLIIGSGNEARVYPIPFSR